MFRRLNIPFRELYIEVKSEVMRFAQGVKPAMLYDSFGC